MPPPDPRTPPPPTWPLPTFNLHVEDLSHPGSVLFFANIDPLRAMRNASIAAFQWLYTPKLAPTNVKTILLVLKSMPGVAHTSGGKEHKQIHLSLDHIVNSSKRARAEICGVLTHEIVHCFQYNGKGKCPGGLVEGIADYVRLQANLRPPHWAPTGKPGEAWDAGYEKTGYFLNWMTHQYGDSTVMDLNAAMRDEEYHPEIFVRVTGHEVEVLWQKYCKFLKDSR